MLTHFCLEIQVLVDLLLRLHKSLKLLKLLKLCVLVLLVWWNERVLDILHVRIHTWQFLGYLDSRGKAW
jgi:hypothetical protein